MNPSISDSSKYSSQALFSGIISLPRKFRFSHPLPFPISFIYFIFSDFASVFCRMGHRCIQDCSRLERQFIRLSGKNIMGKRKELICETTIPKYILYRKAGLNIRPVTGAPCCPETWRPFRRKPLHPANYLLAHKAHPPVLCQTSRNRYYLHAGR